MKILTNITLCTVIYCLFTSWGFYAHKRINEHAVFLLPTDLAVFYKKHIKAITEKAIDPDKRCYMDTIEGPRHYIDLDRYDEIDSIPIHWSKAKDKYTERKLLAQGIIPWQIFRTYNNLVNAFKEKQIDQIIRYSADLGHYIADSHVPLHTTSNYNGQYSNQIGIHAFWETRLPEMFATTYDHFIGPAKYLENPLDEAWKIVKESNGLVDSVLSIEKNLASKFSQSAIKSYIQRNNQLILTYADPYATAYHIALNGMVERRYKKAIHMTASYWYSAWIDAGQPKLNSNNYNDLNPIEQANTTEYNTKKTLGREEWH